MEGAKEQLSRNPRAFTPPTIETEKFTNIFEWKYTDTVLKNYQSHNKIDFEIAV